MKKAFTFLEVMFGLSIVGIISAMVIPVFYNAYSDRIKATQLKKTCGLISYAIEAIMSDESANDTIEPNEEEIAKEPEEEPVEDPTTPVEGNEGEQGDTEEEVENYTSEGFYLTSAGVKTSDANQGAQYFLNKYFKHTKVNCGPGGSNDCIGNRYRSPQKTPLENIPNDYYCIKTNNSAAICMKYDEDNHVTRVVIDVNGSEKPNITGSDLFVMYITSEGSLKDIDDNEANCNKERTTGLTVEGYAAGCFTKVVANGWKMPK